MKILLTGQHDILGASLLKNWKQNYTFSGICTIQEEYISSSEAAESALDKYAPETLLICPHFKNIHNKDSAAETDSSPRWMDYISETSFLLEAIRKREKKPEKIIILSSGSIYADCSKDNSEITEQSAIESKTLEDLSVITIDLMAHQYFRAYHLPIVRLRIFDIFDNAAAQLITRNPNDSAQGGLDLTDLDDLSESIKKAIDKCQAGEVYNVCSEQLTPAEQIKRLLKPQSQPLYSGNTAFKSPGSCSRFAQLTGWKSRNYF